MTIPGTGVEQIREGEQHRAGAPGAGAALALKASRSSARRRHRLAAAVLAAYALLALLYSATVPLWEAPDEPQHYDYVAALVRSGFALPEQVQGQLAESHQPPLHYVLAAVLAAPFDVDSALGRPLPNPQFVYTGQGSDANLRYHGTAQTFPFQGYALAYHVARLLSLLAGAVTVLFTMEIAALLFPARPALMAVAGALAGFTPQFLFISGAVNNDATVTMAATGTLLATRLVLKRPDSAGRWFRLGLWMGFAVLAKLSGAAAALAGGVTVSLALLAGRQRLATVARRLGLAAAATLAVCGWWFGRNQLLYGDPLGLGMYRQVFWMARRQAALGWQDVRLMLLTQLRTYWAEFGWLTVPAPGWFHTGVRALLVVSLVSLLSALLRGDLGVPRSWRRWGLALLALAILAQEGFQLAMAAQSDPSVYQGRYLFPVIAPLSLFIGLGLCEFVGRRRWLLAPPVACLLAAAAFLCFGVIAPAYGMAPLSRWTVSGIPHNEGADFGGQIVLLGRSVQELDEPHRIEMTLYWQATAHPGLDYSAFVHLEDAAGAMLAQDDHGPGDAQGYLPVRWLVGDVVRDVHTLALPPGVAAGDYRLAVGLYDWQTGARLPARLPSGQPAPDGAVFVPVAVAR